MTNETVNISCRDGVALTGTLFRPAGDAHACILICSALGVPRRFYARFAEWLAGEGCAVLIFDYRGTGDSVLATADAGTVCLEDWGRLDLDAALGWLADHFPGVPLFQVGHSCGGQLLGLAENATRVSGALLVAATAPNWKLYPMPGRLQMLFVWHCMVPLVSLGRAVFPARRLGISTIDVPAGVMAQWARWARSRDYLFSPEFGVDTARYGQLSCPMLSLGFDDDGYASAEAIEALLRHYSGARVENRMVAVQSLGVGKLQHFGFFKDKVRDTLWRDALQWMDTQQSAASSG